MATFTRPTTTLGKTVAPDDMTPLKAGAGLLSRAANGYLQGRDTGATKRQWTERYPPMILTAAVQTFLDNIDDYRRQRTSLDVTEKQTGNDATITAQLVDYDYKIVNGRMVWGLEITFAEE